MYAERRCARGISYQPPLNLVFSFLEPDLLSLSDQVFPQVPHIHSVPFFLAFLLPQLGHLFFLAIVYSTFTREPASPLNSASPLNTYHPIKIMHNLVHHRLKITRMYGTLSALKLLLAHLPQRPHRKCTDPNISIYFPTFANRINWPSTILPRASSMGFARAVTIRLHVFFGAFTISYSFFSQD